jgi:hypothetical protein
MDTQPTNQPQEQTPEAVPPSLATPLPPKNKRWEIILGTLLIIIIAGVSAWFILGKNPSTPNPISDNQEHIPTPVDDSQKIQDYPVGDVRNASLNPPYSYNGMDFYITDEIIQLKNGVGTFSYCTGSQNCGNGQVKTATISLSNITAPSDPSMFGDPDWGGAGGAMIMTFDFGNQNAKEYYLATFDMNRQSSSSPYTLYTPPIKNLGTITGTIKNIDITSKGEVAVNIQTNNGLQSRMFSINPAFRYYDITELTPDRTGKIFDDEKFGYSFIYPNGIYTSFGQLL